MARRVNYAGPSHSLLAQDVQRGYRRDLLNPYLRAFHRPAQQSPLVPEVLQLALSLPEPPPALEMSLLNVLFQSSRAGG